MCMGVKCSGQALLQSLIYKQDVLVMIDRAEPAEINEND